MTSLDPTFVRSRFPALADGFVYMDNAGGSQTLNDVAVRLTDYLLHTNVQLGATYAPALAAEARVARATADMAAYVHAAHTDEIVMGPSTTYLLRTLAGNLAQTWQSGDEVVVTNADHEANVDAWTALRRHGIVVKTWKVDPETFRLKLEDLDQLMTPKTRLVAVTHASNILGTINPIKQIADRVHAAGALICVDGVAYAPHRAIDVQAMDVDFYAFSFYKVYGPHYAQLYGRRELLAPLPGNNLAFINTTPYKFQPGNVNFELCHAMGAVPAYLTELGRHLGGAQLTERDARATAFAAITAHEALLADRLLGFLADFDCVRIIGEPDADPLRRVPTLSFVVAGAASETFARVCEPHGIGIRFGDFYAKQLIADHHLAAHGGVVRVSMVHYNTVEEVDRLITALAPALHAAETALRRKS